MVESFNALLQKLQCQFLCCHPLHCIEWQQIPTVPSWEQQQQLIDSTIKHKLNREYPVKVSYQLNFLKRLLQLLEKHVTEIHDVVYESYCAVQQLVAQDLTEKYAYKHYILPAFKTKFTLRESKSFVAAGTTGLCSWQAALALTDYLLHNAAIVKGKRVLELGAGTGLCGMVLIGCCAAKQLTLTDGSQPCVELMRENVQRNFTNAKQTADGEYNIDGQMLSVCLLDWREIEQVPLHMVEPDVLLAADVVYDDTVFDALTNAIDFIFDWRKNACKMLLAATVRNEHTLNKFLLLLEHLEFNIDERNVVPLEKSHLHWDRTTPVKILEISRTKLA